MEGSLERVRRVVAGEKPDRIPLFDLFTNDAVLAHFNDGAPVGVGDDSTAARAISRAVDGSRSTNLSPSDEGVETLDDGCQRNRFRWTTWQPRRKFSSSDEYAAVKRGELADRRRRLEASTDLCEDESYKRHLEVSPWFGDDFYFLLSVPAVGLMDAYLEVGLERFCYYLADCESVIIEYLEFATERACRWVSLIPAEEASEMVFVGEDVAFKNGPMIGPAWMDRHYFPRLKRIVDAVHKKGKAVMFHSDGNLNLIMDALVACGIDALNPIEVAAGMDLADLHRRYPDLIFAGGIDVSNLLPFGGPEDVRDAVVKAIEDAEAQILVGSSTEVIDSVPLENYLAMREAAIGYRL